MSRARRLLGTPFGLAVVGLLVLAGWAVWSAGVFDDAMQRQVRTSSVYAAPGVELDRVAAERIIGNRRLVVVFLERGADLAEACDDVEGAAAGTFVLLFSPDDGEFDHYGCSNFPGDDDETFGKAFVAEQKMPEGADQFLDRPLDALKVVVVNYDGLVKAGTIPDGSRTISSSVSRYVLAAAAVAAVLVGAATVFLVGRRVGRLAAAHREERDAAADTRSALNAKAAVLAGHIIELERRYPRAGKEFRREHRALAAEYAQLATDLTADDPDPSLGTRVDSLTARARDLTRTGAPARPRRRP